MVSDQFLVFLDIFITSMEKKEHDIFREKFLLLHYLTNKKWQAETDKGIWGSVFISNSNFFSCVLFNFLFPLLLSSEIFYIFLLISFEWTIQDRRLLPKPKLWHTVITSYHYPHSGLTQKSRCAPSLCEFVSQLQHHWTKSKQHKALKNVTNPNKILSSQDKVLY